VDDDDKTMSDDDTNSVVDIEVALLESNADETDRVGLLDRMVLGEGSNWPVVDVNIKIELVSDRVGKVDDNVEVEKAVQDDSITELELGATTEPLEPKFCSTALDEGLNEEVDDEVWTDEVDNSTDNEVRINELDEEAEDGTIDEMVSKVITLDDGRAIGLTSKADFEVDCDRDRVGDDGGPLLDRTGLPHRPYLDWQESIAQ
jgi:hypothetical protein